jgi:hypothetical protein
MKRFKQCELCDSTVDLETVCDTCGISTSNSKFVPISVEFNEGHELEGASYDFCSYKCLLQFLLAEIRKQSKINESLEFGKGEN